MNRLAPLPTLYYPIIDEQTIARLLSRYGLDRTLTIATGHDRETHKDLEAWRKLGRRKP